MNFKNLIVNAGSKTIEFVSKYATQILTVGGVGGVLATICVTAKYAPKITQTIEEFEPETTNTEKVKKLAPAVLPVALCGGATCAMIIGSNVIASKRYKELAITTGVAVTTLNKWKEVVKEHVNDQEYKDINKEVDHRMSDELVLPKYMEMVETCGPIADEIFMDSQTGRWFMSNMRYVKDKISDFRYEIGNSFDGVKTLNDFFETLGLRKFDDGDCKGWDTNSDYWGSKNNRFNVRLVPIMVNGRTVTLLEYETYSLSNRY